MIEGSGSRKPTNIRIRRIRIRNRIRTTAATKRRNLFDMVGRGGGGGEGVVYGYGEHVHLLPLAGLLKGSLLQHLQLHAKSYS